MIDTASERRLHIQGACAPEFAAVQETFAENFSTSGEIGAAVCAYKGGKKVVNLWGGYKDVARTVHCEEDTIVIMNSLAKSISALCMHILIDRGKPEFAIAPSPPPDS